MIKLAVELNVAKLAELCIDDTRVQADANKYRAWTVEKAEKLLQELDGRIENALSELETNDQLDDLFDTGEKSDELPEELRDMQARHGTDDSMNPALYPRGIKIGQVVCVDVEAS